MLKICAHFLSRGSTISILRASFHATPPIFRDDDKTKKDSETSKLTVLEEGHSLEPVIKDLEPVKGLESFRYFMEEEVKKKDRIILSIKDGKVITTPKNFQYSLEKRPFTKPLELSYPTVRPEHGVRRALEQLKPRDTWKSRFLRDGFNAFYDFTIIGGGIMGWAIAYSIAAKIPGAHSICVIERDPTYSQASIPFSIGGIRQQFSLPENIEMSLYGADFLRNIDKLLYIHGMELPDVNFQPHGYLFLASEDGADAMEANHATQVACGARVELLTPNQLNRRFPWLNTEGIVMGSYGVENEGWFDPWALLQAFRLKAIDLGVHFVHGEVHNIAHRINKDKIYGSGEEAEDEAKRIYNRVEEVHVELADNGDVYPIFSSQFIIAAGAQSGHIAYLAGIGAGRGMLAVPLPVVPRKRFVYKFHAPTGPGLDCPMVVDPTGTYFRREGYGNHYLCGRSPSSVSEEPDIDNLEVDYNYFDEAIWPVLAHRVPAFKNLKVENGWAGFYDHNLFDQNAIIGDHPHHGNVHFATGFSGHGIQQAPAIGRSFAEIMLDQNYSTIDMKRFNFNRILADLELRERMIV